MREKNIHSYYFTLPCALFLIRVQMFWVYLLFFFSLSFFPPFIAFYYSLSSSYSMPSPNQPTYHQLNSPSPNNPNATLHVMQPPQQSPQIPPQMSPQLGSGAPVGTVPGGYLGRSPPQPAGGGGHHINNNEPGTTSEDSDDAIPVISLNLFIRKCPTKPMRFSTKCHRLTQIHVP